MKETSRATKQSRQDRILKLKAVGWHSRQRLFDFFSGNLPQRTILAMLIPLIFTSYFGTLTFAVVVFPETYDWRSSVISSLLSPRYSPQFHWIPSIGLTVSGLLAIPFGGYIGQRLRSASRLGANIGMASFIVGFVALILAAAIVTRHSHPIIGILGIHEILARTSALGLGFGIISFCWSAIQGSRTASVDQKLYSRSLVSLWTTLAFLALLTLTGAGCCALISKVGAPGFLPFFQLLRHSPLWHLAFWEWVGSVAVFLFLTSAAWLLPRGQENRK
jgi:hypothetical protein